MDHYYNEHRQRKNNGKQRFGTHVQEKHALLIQFRCFPTKRPRRWKTGAPYTKFSMTETNRQESSGHFSRSVAASHWFSIWQSASLTDSYPACDCIQEAEFLTHYVSTHLEITRLTFKYSLRNECQKQTVELSKLTAGQKPPWHFKHDGNTNFIQKSCSNVVPITRKKF